MTVPVLLGYTAWLLQQTPHLMCSLVRMLELTKPSPEWEAGMNPTCSECGLRVPQS